MDLDDETDNHNFFDDQKIRLACIVTAVKTKPTRNNSLMAYVTLEDDTGTMEMLAFSQALGQYGSYLQEGAVLYVEGRLSIQEEKAPQIRCNFVQPLEQAAQRAANSPYGGGGRTVQSGKPGVIPNVSHIYVRIPTITDERVGYVRKVLIMFPGQSQLIFYAEDTKKRYGIPCLIHTSLMRELNEVFGKENVVIK